MSIKTEVTSDKIIQAFRSLGSISAPIKDVITEKLIQKCQQMCQDHDLSPTDLAYKWEAYIDKVLPGRPDTSPEEKHFDGIHQALLKAQRDKDARLTKSAKNTIVKSISRIVNKDSIGQLQDALSGNYGLSTIKLEPLQAPSGINSFVTPAKRGRPSDTPGSLPSSTRARILPTPASKDFLGTPGETPDSMKYSAREEKFKIVSTMNEALGAAEPLDRKSSRCEIKLLQGIQLYKEGRAVSHRHMFERVEQRCMTLRDRLRSITDGIILRNNLRAKALEEDGSDLKMSPVNMPTQEKAWYCGRICPDGDSGSMNASSVLLEGANGKRVHLELAHVTQFAVFPGQIVVLRGNNTSGESINVREMWSDASLPMATTPADKMATWNESEAFLGGLPLSMMMASGPFTSSADLSYQPLEDLLEHVAEQKPDVVILTGPFVDYKHRQLNPDAAGSIGGFSNGDPPDSLQVVRHVMRDIIIQRLAAGSPATTCILIPCLEDLHSRTSFPQPPFDHAEIIQAMDGEIDVPQHVDVQLMGNPCVLRINEIVVGICTSDPIRGLSANEASRCPSDRLTRLANHIVQQRNFYPLFPTAEGCHLSMANINYLGLEQTPDVLLLPSQLNPFAKRIGDVLCVNPGRLTKGIGPGTFARLTVHPIVRHLRTGAAGGSRKVSAGLSISPSAKLESPEKPQDAEASAAASSVPSESVLPLQLSQNFESAAADSKSTEEGGHVETPAEAAASENALVNSASDEAGAPVSAEAGALVAAANVGDSIMQVEPHAVNAGGEAANDAGAGAGPATGDQAMAAPASVPQASAKKAQWQQYLKTIEKHLSKP